MGVHWSVLEVQPVIAQQTTSAERRRPWLVFESDEGEKRRLVPVPDQWLDCSEFELERWCMRAIRVPPAPQRRELDRE